LIKSSIVKVKTTLCLMTPAYWCWCSLLDVHCVYCHLKFCIFGEVDDLWTTGSTKYEVILKIPTSKNTTFHPVINNLPRSPDLSLCIWKKIYLGKSSDVTLQKGKVIGMWF